MAKGFAFAVVGAALAAALWVVLIRVTDWNLWILAPVVGGLAGYGMMRGTQMRGGLPAGALAAVVALVVIFAARYIVVSGVVQEELVFDESDIIDELAYDVAEEWTRAGYEIYDEEVGDFLPAVYQEAEARWAGMSDDEARAHITALMEQSEEAAAMLTPLGLLFDFGIFGTVCAALAIGTAFKLGSVTLEEALIERGHAADADHAQTMATTLRGADTGIFGRLGREAADPQARAAGTMHRPKQQANEPRDVQRSAPRKMAG